MRYAEIRAEQIRNIDKERAILLLPLGSCEQHGQHLPVFTDTIIISRIAEELEKRFPNLIVLTPTVWVGSSSSHLRFPGVVSVDALFYAKYLINICNNYIRDGFKRIFLLNGHGGNIAPARVSLRMIKDEHPDIQVVFSSYWDLAQASIQSIRESGPGGIGHACELETSLMLFLEPELVQMEKAKNGGRVRESKYIGCDIYDPSRVLVAFDHDELNPLGVHGEPEIASKEKGVRFFDGVISDIAGFIEELQFW